MNKTEQLYMIAKNAVSSFMQKEASLNDGILKGAKESKLNEEEIKRVSEIANTRAYIEMRKTAESNYVTFDVANPEEIIKEAGLKPIETVNTVAPQYHSDYSNAPSKAAEMEKVAEVETVLEKTAAEISYQMPYYEKQMGSIKDNIQMQSLNFDQRITTLTKQVRQLLRQGVDVDHIKSLFVFVDKSNLVWDAVSSQLAEEYPMIKEANSTEGSVNVSHTIVQQTNELVKIAKQIVTDAIMYDSLHDAITKESALIVEKLKPAAKKLGIIAALGASFSLGSASERKKEDIKKINQYNNLRPRGPIQ